MTAPETNLAETVAQQPLDPQLAEIFHELFDAPLPSEFTSPAQALSAARLSFPMLVTKLRGTATSPYPMVITDEEVPGDPPVRVRTYAAPNGTSNPDVLLFIHGGGWVIGAPEDLDYEMCAFAHHLDMRVVSVDYRLAPEHPYPAAFNDCMLVARQLHQDPQVGRIAVAGDSAGGNLAAAVAIGCRDEGITLVAQLLIYPALDPTQQLRSHDVFGVGYGLTKADMVANWSAYLPQPHLWQVPTAAPPTAASLRGVAPAVVVTAGYDPLCDEGDAYASRLAAESVPTTHLQNPSLAHAFLIMTPRVEAADTAVQLALTAFAHYLKEEPSVHDDYGTP